MVIGVLGANGHQSRRLLGEGYLADLDRILLPSGDKSGDLVAEPCFRRSLNWLSKLLEVEHWYLYLNYWSYSQGSLNGYQFLVDFHKAL
jgi:hypothetical protein